MNLKNKEGYMDKTANIAISRVDKEMRKSMDLKDTVKLMNSPDYKERFKAEYWQTKIRYMKLDAMLDNWDGLEFTPTCSRTLLEIQLDAMSKYLDALKARADVEGIIL